MLSLLPLCRSEKGFSARAGSPNAEPGLQGKEHNAAGRGVIPLEAHGNEKMTGTKPDL